MNEKITQSAPNGAPAGDTFCGFVALLGAPNAGKSTLTNALVGQKIAIVSQKVQTTRIAMRGIFIHGAAQIILVDTPGVFRPKRRLDRAMLAQAWGGAEDADLLAHVVDAPAAARLISGKRLSGSDLRTGEDIERVEEGMKAGAEAGRGKPAILVLNKIDLLPKESLFALAEGFFAKGLYQDVVMVSADRGHGLAQLKELMTKAMPKSVWHYPEDQVADMPQRLMAAEITREKVFLRLHDELPYGASVETDEWTERKDGTVRIDQTLYVSRESHKSMAIGKGGAALKWISQSARKELCELLEREVHLFVHVKVRENWLDEKARFTALGLDFQA